MSSGSIGLSIAGLIRDLFGNVFPLAADVS
jgi:hypothetical protein